MIMRRLATVTAVLVSLAVPSSALASSPLSVSHAKALIRHAIGPGTVVSDCRPHDHGLLCRFVAPAESVSIETEDPQATWESYAAVVRGHVRVASVE